MKPTLFQSLLGASFYALPSCVRALHQIRGRGRYVGRAEITRGGNPLARLCAAFARLPPAMADAPLTVDFQADAAGEVWTRHFGGQAGKAHRMRSRLRARNRRLVERLGPLQFRFEICVHEEAIHWHAEGVRLFGLLPLPAGWFAGVACREGEHEGRYTFLVDASLPLIGRLVRYEGWLQPEHALHAQPDAFADDPIAALPGQA
ncbi:DUF4166 domain-containing protein [Luteimonas aquatica]|uniref:DUF4166 domain-containing protein n=1 Tax=Luteimonas aquatica TaxID=450364 RepID=UPI001F59087B|nr:DUF4166 domain-containing protein [Luteimonas aquatica]